MQPLACTVSERHSQRERISRFVVLAVGWRADFVELYLETVAPGCLSRVAMRERNGPRQVGLRAPGQVETHRLRRYLFCPLQRSRGVARLDQGFGKVGSTRTVVDLGASNGPLTRRKAAYERVVGGSHSIVGADI